MRNLSDRQRETLDFIRDYVHERGVAPSRAEIAKALGLAHKSTVDDHLSGLMKKGWIELKPGSPRNIRLLKEDLPIMVAGRISAGAPAFEEYGGFNRIPRHVAQMFSPRPDYFLRIQGDSMNRLGLRTGTVVAIRGQEVAEHRQVIAAQIGEEVTLKRLIYNKDREIELHPESTNPKHKPIRVDLDDPFEEFHVMGIAVGALLREGFQDYDPFESCDPYD